MNPLIYRPDNKYVKKGETSVSDGPCMDLAQAIANRNTLSPLQLPYKSQE